MRLTASGRTVLAVSLAMALAGPSAPALAQEGHGDNKDKKEDKGK